MDNKGTCNFYELQLSLENSLCLLVKKYNVLSKKLSNSGHLDKKDEKLKASEIGERRGAISEGKPYKKIKLSSEKSQKSSFSSRAKGKRTQPAKSQENGFPEKCDIPKLQKNDSNRFWSFLDCYCCDVTTEDTKVLEKWIESHDRDAEYQDIPGLGIHYSSKWTEDEILEEKKEGTKSMENPKGTDFASIQNCHELEFLRKTQDKINSIKPEEPPLAEKLISSLVQENIITSPNDIMTECVLDEDFHEKKAGGRYLPFERSLENCLRSQLAELDVLQRDFKTEESDELFQELKKLHSLLVPISEFNLQKKKALLSRAKAEIAKQEAQKRVQETDAKVMESYRLMAAARLKGKKLSKKEQSQIRNILEERDVLIKNTIDS